MQHKSKITYFFALEVRRMVLNGFRINICQKIFSVLIENGIVRYQTVSLFYEILVNHVNIIVHFFVHQRRIYHCKTTDGFIRKNIPWDTIEIGCENRHRSFIWHKFFSIPACTSYNNVQNIPLTYLPTQNQIPQNLFSRDINGYCRTFLLEVTKHALA